MIISKNPHLLESSLDKMLKLSIGVIKEVLELDAIRNNISDLMSRILSGHLYAIGKDSTLRSNITYMRSCGVVGPQLIMLLKTVPRLFTLSETQIKLLVSQATKIGFTMGSRMLAYGLRVLYGNSAETINRKFEWLQSFGFTRNECNEALLKMPVLFETSDAKLRRGIEFFLHTVMLDKSKLVRTPHILMFSMEKRVIPRHKILETIKSRSLLKEEPYFITELQLSDKKFVEKYISRFADDAEVLRVLGSL